jgi:outer membrane protein assembly factor BamB
VLRVSSERAVRGQQVERVGGSRGGLARCSLTAACGLVAVCGLAMACGWIGSTSPGDDAESAPEAVEPPADSARPAGGLGEMVAAEISSVVPPEQQQASPPSNAPTPTPTPTPARDWPTYQGDPQRTGWARAAPAIASPKIRWKREVGIQGYLNAPLILGSTVVVPSSGDRHNKADDNDGLHALDAVSGAPVWHVRSNDDANGATAHDGVVVFTSDDKRVRAVELSSGKVQWEKERASKVYSTPLVIGGNVVVGDRSGAVVALDLATGNVAWEHGYKGAIRGGLASDGTRVFAVSQGGDVAAIDAGGIELWRRRVTRPGWNGRGTVDIEGYNAPVVDGDRLVVPFARDTYYETGPALVALAIEDGRELWRASSGSVTEHWGNLRSSPGLADGLLVWAEPYSGDVVGLDVATGVPEFRTTVGACLFPQYASPAIAGTQAYVPRHDGVLHAVTLPSGTTRWKLYLGEARTAGPAPASVPPTGGCSWEVSSGSPLYAPPAIGSDGTVFVGSGEGFLYAIEES